MRRDEQRYRWTGISGLVGLAVCAACSPAPSPSAGGADSVQSLASVADAGAPSGSASAVQGMGCEPTAPVADRASAYDSTVVEIAGAGAKVCYSRPLARSRAIFGQLVPYDTLWRTGANEPTIIHIPFRGAIAGIPVQPGSYSLYTVPREREWTVVVNRSTSQWGHESRYTPEVRAQEVGRANVTAERTPTAVEQFTLRSEPKDEDEAFLVLEWENSRVRIPIRRD